MKSSWKRRYCVLTNKALTCYSNSSMRVKKHQIPLSQIISADPIRVKGAKLTNYQIETEAVLLVMDAEDFCSRNEWIQDIQLAIQCNRKEIENVHFLKAEERYMERKKLRAKKIIEETEKLQMKEFNEQLNAECQRLQNQMENSERQQKEAECERIQVLEAKVYSLTENKTEIIDRLREDLTEKAIELDIARQRIAQNEEELANLRQLIKEQQQKNHELLARNMELVAKEKELLKQINNMKGKGVQVPYPNTHRGKGAFPEVFAKATESETFPTSCN